jgi:hypothetical protein
MVVRLTYVPGWAGSVLLVLVLVLVLCCILCLRCDLLLQDCG